MTRRVLIRLPNWVGDAVMAAPAVLGLGEARPDWEWLLLGGVRSLPLYEGLEEPFRLLPPLEAGGTRPSSFLRALAALRRERLDGSLILPPSFSSAWMAAIAGIPVRVGWPTDSRRRLLTDATLLPSRDHPLRDQYRALAGRLLDLLDPGRSRWSLPEGIRRLPLRPEEFAWADAWWKDRALDPGGTLVLAPGASFGATKRWPEERYRTLGAHLLARGWNLLWIGGEGERELCRRLAVSAAALPVDRTLLATVPAAPAGATAGRSIALAGDLPVRRSLALLAGVRAAVSNDSGALHLAQAAGCPVVGIYGSTSPEWTGPGGTEQAVVREAVPCAPCFAPRCPTRIECLTGIGIGRVGEALGGLLRPARSFRGRPAVFLDRDGTILSLVPYLRTVEETRLAPGAAEGLRRLRAAGFALVVVTNQSAVARGLLGRSELRRIHLRMAELLRAEGVVLDGIEVCPHHPEFTGPCFCRKPEPGLLRRAAHRACLDLARSFSVGDAISDLEAGRRAGTQTVLLRTGYGRDLETSLAPAELARAADAVCDDLAEAAEWIVSAVAARP